ncbi:MAG: caspase family protein [Planctomycetaceae bacterium]|jgi:hypothetical protein|nr:caspase family protein [Planctomycetaceae bacterium]
MKHLFFFLFLTLLVSPLYANGKLIVVIIAATYQNSQSPIITRLPYTVFDAEFVSESLNSHGFPKSDRLLLLEGETPEPTKSNLEKELRVFLHKKCSPEDTVIVYFSGHGILGENGQTSKIVPSDFNADNLDASSVSVNDLRKLLGHCEAKTKFLLLDCCHSGSETSLVPAGIIKSVPVEDSLDVITIASCGANEKSHYWKDKNLSLFSYYLGEALRGDADSDQNQTITADELFGYLYNNVSRTATKLGFVQNPVRILRSGVKGNPTLLAYTKQNQTLDQFFDNTALKIAAEIQKNKITITGALPFLTVSEGNKTTTGTAELGNLPKQCSEKLQTHLIRHGISPIHYDVIKNALREQNLTVDDVYSGKINTIAGTIKFIDPNAVKSFIIGKITRHKQIGCVSLTCELMGLPNVVVLGTYNGTVQLSNGEIANTGQSMQPPRQNNGEKRENKFTANALPSAETEYRPEVVPASILPPLPANNSLPVSLVPIPSVDATIFKVSILVKRGNRFVAVEPIYKDGKTFVPLERGDIYRIRITNPANESVLVRVLVDGLNTLPEEIREPKPVKFAAIATADKMQYIELLRQSGAIIERNDEGTFYRVASPASLDDARPWVFAPYKTSEITGFFHQTGKSGSYKEFRVTDAPFSVAGQTNFTDQLGLISIGFFRFVPNSATQSVSDKGARVGTGMGNAYQIRVREVDDFVVGGILETQQIYYAPHSDLDLPKTFKGISKNIRERTGR